jgi:DNA-binding response OmpR family regulator
LIYTVKILVVDDEEDTLSSIKEILEKENYKVTGVNTGLGAIKEVKNEKFDLVILDIMMPHLSGWDTFSKIREINSIQKVMFLSVIESSELSRERKMNLEKSSNVEYLSKPFDRSVLVERVKSMIEVGRKK